MLLTIDREVVDMLLAVIAACEVLFWVFLLAGLVARYPLRRPRLGAALLICAPLVDLVLLVVSAIDLRTGAQASSMHALAAIYLGVSVGFGHRMIHWADVRFAHKFAGGPAPEPKPRAGPARASLERAGWYRHVLAWGVGMTLMALAVLLIGDLDRAGALVSAARLWTVILVIDGLVSFSYGRPERAGAITTAGRQAG